jgi:carbonic anhydrase
MKNACSIVLFGCIVTAPLLFTLMRVPVNAQEQTHHPHWAYEGEGGPDHWADLSPDFSACKMGRKQSPIDIRNTVTSDLPAIIFDYKPSSLKIIDNGHTVQVNYAPGSMIIVGNKRYQLLQFHFHHPSEERINGKAYEMVAHLVHADNEGNKAVVAVLFQEGQSNPLLSAIFAHVPKTKNHEEEADVSINAMELLPTTLGYYTFPGSLTTPPCSEGVTWLVLKAPLTLSKSELGLFTRLYAQNARPTQPLNGRTVLSGR